MSPPESFWQNFLQEMADAWHWITDAQEVKEHKAKKFTMLYLALAWGTLGGWVTSFQIFSWNRNSCGATHAAMLVGLMPLGLLLQSQGFLTWCNKLSFQLFITFKDQQEVEISPQRFSSSLQIWAFQILQITSIFLHLIVSFPWIHDLFFQRKKINSPYFLSVYLFLIFIYFSKLN